MARTFDTALATAGLATVGLLLAGCGGHTRAAHTPAEVRAMFAAVNADGRAHRYQRICQHHLDAQLQQLAHLVGANCAKTMAAEWAEGVQLARIGASTRIVITGDAATVFDGGAPDRAVYTDGHWEMAETPRNQRYDTPHEAREATTTINQTLREHHLPTVRPEAE
jgi:hypothetical protein